jgi:hypothetical protein
MQELQACRQPYACFTMLHCPHRPIYRQGGPPRPDSPSAGPLCPPWPTGAGQLGSSCEPHDIPSDAHSQCFACWGAPLCRPWLACRAIQPRVKPAAEEGALQTTPPRPDQPGPAKACQTHRVTLHPAAWCPALRFAASSTL